MSCKEEKICRLCLKESNSDFEVIEEVAREIFSVLLLKVNLSITKDPVMCKNCAENLQKCFDFKAACMNVEDCIGPLTSATNGSKVDINKVFLTENKNVGSVDRHICRFCLQGINRGHYKCLDVLDRDIVFAEDTLAKYMPEMNLEATNDPVICTTCEESLKNYVLFVKNCWDTEQRIVQYCRTKGTDSEGQIRLRKVLHYINMGCIKTETNLSDDEECTDVEISDKDLVKIEQEEVNIKSEGDLIRVKQTDRDSPRSSGTLPKSKRSPRFRVIGKAYKCAHCTYETKYKQSVERHMLFHKDPSEIEMYKCPECTYETRWRYNLRNHVMVHKDPSEVEMYKCDICPYEAKVKHKLKRHMITHKDPSELKMYKCELCTYWTKRLGSLKRHIVTHKTSV